MKTGGAVVLKLCNRSRGAGVVVVRSKEMKEIKVLERFALRSSLSRSVSTSGD